MAEMKQHMSEVLLEREGPIAWLRMNRPEAHNAFSREMMALMAEQVRQLASDRDARVAILCGNGPSFCTGLDVKELARGELEVEFFVDWNRMMRSLRELPIPLIAAIHGHCLGGGTMLTLEADYRLASDDLHIGLGALRLGILPGSAPEVLPAIVGAATARRHCACSPSMWTRMRRCESAWLTESCHASRSTPRPASLPNVCLGSRLRRCASASRYWRSAGTLDADGYERAFREAQQRCLDDRDPG